MSALGQKATCAPQKVMSVLTDRIIRELGHGDEQRACRLFRLCRAARSRRDCLCTRYFPRTARLPRPTTKSDRNVLALATSNCAMIVEYKGSGMSLLQDLRQNGIYAIGVAPDGDKIIRMNDQR